MVQCTFYTTTQASKIVKREINVECILREMHHFSHDYDSPFEPTFEAKSD
jgi:hypothetical protein